MRLVPFNHPLTPLDLDELERALDQRPDEDRDVVMVCLGVEIAARAWVVQHNRARPVNRVEVVELRSDPRYGGIIAHQPMSASVAIAREGDELVVEITDVFSPTIVARLDRDEGPFRAEIDD